MWISVEYPTFLTEKKWRSNYIICYFLIHTPQQRYAAIHFTFDVRISLAGGHYCKNCWTCRELCPSTMHVVLPHVVAKVARHVLHNTWLCPAFFDTKVTSSVLVLPSLFSQDNINKSKRSIARCFLHLLLSLTCHVSYGSVVCTWTARGQVFRPSDWLDWVKHFLSQALWFENRIAMSVKIRFIVQPYWWSSWKGRTYTG